MPIYRFVEWTDETGAVVGTTPAITLLIDRDRTLTAHYEVVVPTHALTISATPGGTTDPSPGSYTHSEGIVVGVTAYPDSGYLFDHWELDGVARAENPIDVLMDRDHTLHAVFVTAPPPGYTLTISSTVGGTTYPAPGVHTHPGGTVVSVTAVPDAGYRFNHWEIDGAVRTENPIDVVMDKNYALHAVFEAIPPPEHILTITSTAGGTTDPSPGAYSYPVGTVVTVTAIPDAGYLFDHWELDGVTRTENPIDVLIDRDHTLHAVFVEAPPAPPPPKIDMLALGLGLGVLGIAYYSFKK